MVTQDWLKKPTGSQPHPWQLLSVLVGLRQGDDLKAPDDPVSRGSFRGTAEVHLVLRPFICVAPVLGGCPALVLMVQC